MSSKVRRGRVFFLVLASIILLDQLSSIVFALSGGFEQLRVVKSIVVPLGVVFSVLSLWQGEKWCRRFTTAYALLHGGHYAFIAGFLTYHLVKATPPDKADVFMKLFALPLAIPLAIGAFYIFVSLALLFSPSLKAFLKHQDDFGAAHPLGKLTEWFRGKIERDPASAARRRLMHSILNRKRYSVLTREILGSLDDLLLHYAIIDHVDLKAESSRSSEYETVTLMPRGFQAVYSTSLAGSEISNGGIHQFFFNKGIDWAFMALEGYRLLGATKFADAMAQAIDVYLQEEQEQLSHQTDNPTDMIEQDVEARKTSKLPDLDPLFKGCDGRTDAVRFIRAHLNDFVTG